MTDNISNQMDINKDIHYGASKALARIGLSIPEACRFFLMKIPEDININLDLFTPNAETLKSIKEF
ncbi:MAG: type II toxin-antitoxin system RelB/DinJ family antitoxin [Deltaproteobacteria bacterium]|nr:type II toxin-antitoxin system RelB/DinJ family antitoxin [Deltaproteobacteria bacterium]